jgi:competence protein ComGC
MQTWEMDYRRRRKMIKKMIKICVNNKKSVKLERGTVRAFTLIEMLIVLAIISILILLFVPNLIKEKAQVQKTGEAAVVKVVESQAQLYELDHDDTPTLTTLMSAKLISEKQKESYDDYYAQNKDEKRALDD